nr:polysaccharide deacetylase family protein [Aquisalimonas asiatica]
MLVQSSRLLFSGLSPRGSRAKLTILIFHRVLAEADPMQGDEATAASFDWQMRLLAENANVLPLDEAVERLSTGTLPARAVAITFDDGYADNHDVALPILRRHGLHATFFIASGYLDGGWMFNDTVRESLRHAPNGELDLTDLELGLFTLKDTPLSRARAFGNIMRGLKYMEPERRADAADAIAERTGLPAGLGSPMMTSDQLLAMRRAGMGIGAHTVTHPILSRVTDRQARDEIGGSRERLEALLGERVSLFAYPNGKPGVDYTSTHTAMVREAGFSVAVSTSWGAAPRGASPYELPRFTPWDQSRARYLVRLARNTLQPFNTAPAMGH